MNIIGIVQARVGSTRLPEKIFIDIHGRQMLEIVMDRLRANSARVKRWVIATTTSPHDDPVVTFAEARGIEVFRGSEDDLLDRYYRCALAFGAEAVLRTTGDNPFMDGAFADLAVQEFVDGGFDYVGGTLGHSYPLGMNPEVVRVSDLATAWREAVDPAWREHVTPFFYMQQDRYRCHGMRFERDVHHMRWTVDTPEDLRFARTVFSSMDRFDFTWREAVEACERHPEWVAINAAVKQRFWTERDTP